MLSHGTVIYRRIMYCYINFSNGRKRINIRGQVLLVTLITKQLLCPRPEINILYIIMCYKMNWVLPECIQWYPKSYPGECGCTYRIQVRAPATKTDGPMYRSSLGPHRRRRETTPTSCFLGSNSHQGMPQHIHVFSEHVTTDRFPMLRWMVPLPLHV